MGRSEGITLKNLTKQFGALTAVDDVSLDIEAGEFVSLLGPSGCGKTTLLRMIAGFEMPTRGQIFIGPKDVTNDQPRNRPTAMVFQNYALFPNMTVGENVGYGLQVQKVDRAERRKRVEAALARVDLTGFEKKPVTQLSGGQQQRVALARALAVEPQVILFDEPLSNLDVALREQTRQELKVLHQQLGTTSVYVTHDQQEALALSDRIAVMRSGRLMQVGKPEALYKEPSSAFVAQFLGGSNLIEEKSIAERLSGESCPPGHVLAVRPEQLELVQTEGSDTVPARIISRQFLGLYTEWWVETDGTELRLWMDAGIELSGDIYIKAGQHRWVSQTQE